MKKKLLLLASVALLAAAPAKAATFTQSDFAGSGNFGTATASCLDASCDQVGVNVNMDPNILLQTGSHFLFNLSLAGSGFIDATSIDLAQGTNIAVLTHTSPASYSNGPFKFFSDGISADCGHGGSSGGCGSTLSFTIDNFSGFLFATTQFNNMNIIAAADALLTDCTGGCTGPVGLTGDLVPTPFAVPTPIAGSGPLFISGLAGLWALMRRRKKRLGLDLPISKAAA
jgi:hypothetical protein